MTSIAEIFDTMEYGPAPESEAAAVAWLESHNRKFDLYINGTWTAPLSGKHRPSTNPARGATLAQVANAGDKDVDVAVEAARAAFEKWSITPGFIRARYLYAIARGVQKHARLLSVLEAMDNGKPLRETRDIDVPLLARHFYYHAGWAQLMESEFPGYVAKGVIGQVIPWNFPLLMMAWKIAPAIALGNTVILKPASYTPLSALMFAEICTEAGLPPGVINIVTGNSQAGATIVAHPGVDKVAFTGSTEVGQVIRRATAGTGKSISLELGGKSPFIVFEDADIDSAIEGVVDAIWFNQGQVCCAGSRLLVQESIADTFHAKLKERMAHLRVGDPLDKAVDIGAIVDQRQWETIDDWVKIGVKEGGELFQPDIDLPAQGCFYPPTLFTGVEPAATIAQEEIFGPVLVSMTFRTISEAIALANNTRYGLAASIWSDNINVALDVASRVKAGSIWVNCTNLFDAAAGFGGYRESGYGREGGREGLFEYMRPAWDKPPHADAVEQPVPEGWASHTPSHTVGQAAPAVEEGEAPPIDRTPKMYIGGGQKRPDGSYTRSILSPDGTLVGQVGDGNRKDIRNAVEAAHKARTAGWPARNAFNRSQILYFIGENLYARAAEFAARIEAQTGRDAASAREEVDLSIRRLFTYAAWCDKYGGTVQETTLRGAVLALNEPVGVIGIACPDEFPLLGFVSLVAPAIARGNTTVVIPSQPYPLSATDLYQVLDTSDLPGGVVNIVTGDRDHLTKTLVDHDDVDAMWYFGTEEGSRAVEYLSAGNMKQTWVGYGVDRDWLDPQQGEGEVFLRKATQVKNIWVPTGG